MLACSSEPNTSTVADREAPFDFWVLSLSWSPSYCEAAGDRANRRQCSRDDGFVVHGLWPQFENGWPEFCDSDEPERVPDALVETAIDLMPSAGLIGHQWRKHGTCAGSTQNEYLRSVRAAFERIVIPARFEQAGMRRDVDPDDVKNAFLRANEGMPAAGIAVTCDRQRLREVRICLDRALEFRSCQEVAARGCTLPVADLPPIGR